MNLNELFAAYNEAERKRDDALEEIFKNLKGRFFRLLEENKNNGGIHESIIYVRDHDHSKIYCDELYFYGDPFAVGFLSISIPIVDLIYEYTEISPDYALDRMRQRLDIALKGGFGGVFE